MSFPRTLCVFLFIISAGFTTTVHGGTSSDPLDLAALKGKVVYVDFWASWCEPCRLSFPWMNDLQRQFGKEGFVVVAVNLDRERDDAQVFLDKFAPAFKIIFDPDGAVAERFKVKGMPTSFLVDRAGRVQLTHAGFRPKDREPLEQQIRALLSTN